MRPARAGQLTIVDNAKPNRRPLAPADSDPLTYESFIYRKAFLIGSTWVLLSSCFIQLVYVVYVYLSWPAQQPAFLLGALIQLVLLGGAATIVGRYRRYEQCPARAGLMVVVLVSLCWCLTTFNIVYFWQNIEAAERVVIFGFFTMLVGWFSNYRLLLAGLAPLMAMYIHVLQAMADRHLLMMLLSVVSFPCLLVIFTFTLRRMFLTTIQKRLEGLIRNQQLQAISRTDELTGILNRKGYNESLEQAVSTARRLSSPLLLLVLDIDHFKLYNDSFGHPAGDKCLQRVAGVFAGQLRRATDVLARIGGEEFAMVLPGVEPAQGIALAQALQQALHDVALPHPDSPTSPLLTVSIGIAELMTGEDASRLYQKADSALYAAKHQGRNRWVVYGAAEGQRGSDTVATPP